MPHCPKCACDSTHRSSTRSRWESLRRRLTGKRPYRCRQCGWRGWGPDAEPHRSPSHPDVELKSALDQLDSSEFNLARVQGLDPASEPSSGQFKAQFDEAMAASGLEDTRGAAPKAPKSRQRYH